MLNNLKSVALFGGTFLLIFLSQISIIYLLPNPLNKINVVLLSVLWLVIYKNNPFFIWFVPIICLTVDLFSSQPFGLTTVAMTATVIATRRIFQFFSTFSWYSIFILALLGTFFYRLFNIIFLLALHYLNSNPEAFRSSGLILLFQETIVNAVAFLVAYIIARLLKKPGRIYQSVL